MLGVEAGDVTLGKPLDFPSFGWDNEYGSRQLHVRSFRASKFCVTNGQFLEFVKEGGYRTKEYWTEEGWMWRTFRNAKKPTFWEWDGPQGMFSFKVCFRGWTVEGGASDGVFGGCLWVSGRAGMEG
jgi:formylglycine-generating enzyme required for sulfatase activity